MISVTTRGGKETAARLGRAVGETRSALERAVQRSSVLLSRETRLQLSGKGGSDPFLGRKGAAAPFLGVRSGGTRSRITPGGRVYRSGNTYTSAVGSPDAYMKTHEEGGTITPKSSKFLRIPLAAAQTSAGVDRQAGRGLRSVPDLFVVRTLGGRLLIARNRGRGLNRGRVEFLYLLVRSVTLPARRPFAAVRNRVAPTVNAMTGGEVAVVMGRANGG